MAKFKTGDVCEIVETYSKYATYRGRECTVVAVTYFSQEQFYDITVKDDDGVWEIGEGCLKKIDPSKNAKDEEAFKSFMDKVLMPVPVLEEV